jgi:hypothetical protein
MVIVYRAHGLRFVIFVGDHEPAMFTYLVTMRPRSIFWVQAVRLNCSWPLA